MKEFIAWQSALHLGDLASIVGLLLSIVGFAATILGVFSSRKAAQRAELAAKAAVLRIRVFDELLNLTAAITTLDEIRRFHRIEQWTMLPDRYTSLRRTLISILNPSLSLTGAQRLIVQRTLATLETIEKAVEKGLSDPARLDGARFNSLLFRDVDGLVATLNELRNLHTDGGDGKS